MPKKRKTGGSTPESVDVKPAASVDPEAELEQRMRADFKVFLWAIWRELGLPTPTRMQYDMADYLQHGPRRRMIQAFRGIGKSWITAAFVLWRLWLDPNERILVISASKDRSDAFSLFCKRLISDIEWLQYLQPDPSKNQRDSLVGFDVGPSDPHQAPSVRSVGISGQITGGRASIIIADDIEVPKNSLTVTMREKLSEAIKEFDAVLMSAQDLKAMGREKTSEVIYLGTPQTVMSLYNALPSRGYDVRIWPARYPNEKMRKAYGAALAPIIVDDLTLDPTLAGKYMGRGAPTDPHRFNDIDLMEREASYGRSGFALQFMLDTSLSDANKYPLKLADLIVMDVDSKIAPIKMAWGSSPEQLVPGPESAGGLPVVGLPGDRYFRPMFVDKQYTDFQGVAMAIDPSGRGGDETGYAIVAMLHGMLFTLALGGLKGGYDPETLKKLALLAKKYGVKHIIIESNFGDGMFTQLFKPVLLANGYPCTCEEINSSVQKEARIIDTLEPIFNQHRMVVDSTVIRGDYNEDEQEYTAFFQMTRITRDRGCLKRYDRLDAWAMVCAYWSTVLDQDNATAAQSHKEEAVKQALLDFEAHVFGHKPTTLSFTRSITG